MIFLLYIQLLTLTHLPLSKSSVDSVTCLYQFFNTFTHVEINMNISFFHLTLSLLYHIIWFLSHFSLILLIFCYDFYITSLTPSVISIQFIKLGTRPNRNKSWVEDFTILITIIGKHRQLMRYHGGTRSIKKPLSPN